MRAIPCVYWGGENAVDGCGAVEDGSHCRRLCPPLHDHPAGPPRFLVLCPPPFLDHLLSCSPCGILARWRGLPKRQKCKIQLLKGNLRCSFISFHFISFHFISFHFISSSLHFISFHFISFHFISFHFISFPFHLISFHFHFISFQFHSLHFTLFYFLLFYFTLLYIT
jgi:hypothetical protein